MTFMHMDATIAAAAVGNIVGFTWEDTPPYSGIALQDGGDGFWGEAQFRIFGVGTASPGLYKGEEHNFEVLSEEWINPTFVGNIDQYFHRSIDITTWTDGSFPGTQYSYSGVWTDGRTDWRSFDTVAPHTNMSSDVLAFWGVDAAGSYGSSYYEEQLGCIVEIGKAGTGISETFDFGDVSTGLDQITINGHGFITGDQVIFTQGSAAGPTPMLNNAMYSVRYVDSNTISIGNNLGSIDATPVFLNLATQGTGTGHTLQRIDAVASVLLDMDASI